MPRNRLPWLQKVAIQVNAEFTNQTAEHITESTGNMPMKTQNVTTKSTTDNS